MKRPLTIFAASLVFSQSLVTVASAQCVSSSDRAPLRTAAMQQELMVAALKCHDINEYNRFVLSHQPELISSDQALESYFQRGDKVRGTATYNKYKTELANAASLRSSQDPDGFCDAAGRLFDFAMRPMSLKEIVASVDLESDRTIENCPILADNRATLAGSPPRPVWPSRSESDPPYPDRASSAPAWNSGEEDIDSGHSMESQARHDNARPYDDWSYDDDSDE